MYSKVCCVNPPLRSCSRCLSLSLRSLSRRRLARSRSLRCCSLSLRLAAASLSRLPPRPDPADDVKRVVSAWTGAELASDRTGADTDAADSVTAGERANDKTRSGPCWACHLAARDTSDVSGSRSMVRVCRVRRTIARRVQARPLSREAQAFPRFSRTVQHVLSKVYSYYPQGRSPRRVISIIDQQLARRSASYNLSLLGCAVRHQTGVQRGIGEFAPASSNTLKRDCSRSHAAEHFIAR